MGGSVSANIELPTQADLAQLAPDKSLEIIESTMAQIREGVLASHEDIPRHRSAPSFAPAGQTTQMVVGATPSTDTDILSTASRLYQRYGLKRVYYSAFSPYPNADPCLPLQPPALLREHRLYQADWLTRFYGFSADELTTAEDPNLAFDLDPKLAWALRHRAFFPLDLNRAPREALLRVPGLGYKNVDRILSIRRFHRLTLDDLRKLHVPVRRAQPFVAMDGSSHPPLHLDREDLPALLTRPAQWNCSRRRWKRCPARCKDHARSLLYAHSRRLVGCCDRSACRHESAIGDSLDGSDIPSAGADRSI